MSSPKHKPLSMSAPSKSPLQEKAVKKQKDSVRKIPRLPRTNYDGPTMTPDELRDASELYLRQEWDQHHHTIDELGRIVEAHLANRSDVGVALTAAVARVDATMCNYDSDEALSAVMNDFSLNDGVEYIRSDAELVAGGATHDATSVAILDGYDPNFAEGAEEEDGVLTLERGEKVVEDASASVKRMEVAMEVAAEGQRVVSAVEMYQFMTTLSQQLTIIRREFERNAEKVATAKAHADAVEATKESLKEEVSEKALAIDELRDALQKSADSSRANTFTGEEMKGSSLTQLVFPRALFFIDGVAADFGDLDAAMQEDAFSSEAPEIPVHIAECIRAGQEEIMLHLAYVDIPSFAGFSEADASTARLALRVYHDVLFSAMSACDGFCLLLDADAGIFAFPTAESAIIFSSILPLALLRPPIPWPVKLLAHRCGTEVLATHGHPLFRGLVTRMVLHSGNVTVSHKSLPGGGTKRVVFGGPVIEELVQTALFAVGGEILVSDDVISGNAMELWLRANTERMDRVDETGRIIDNSPVSFDPSSMVTKKRTVCGGGAHINFLICPYTSEELSGHVMPCKLIVQRLGPHRIRTSLSAGNSTLRRLTRIVPVPLFERISQLPARTNTYAADVLIDWARSEEFTWRERILEILHLSNKLHVSHPQGDADEFSAIFSERSRRKRYSHGTLEKLTVSDVVLQHIKKNNSDDRSAFTVSGEAEATLGFHQGTYLYLVYVDIASSAAMWNADSHITSLTLKRYVTRVKHLLKNVYSGALPLHHTADTFVIAFPSPVSAVLFSADLHLLFMRINWGDDFRLMSPVIPDLQTEAFTIAAERTARTKTSANHVLVCSGIRLRISLHCTLLGKGIVMNLPESNASPDVSEADQLDAAYASAEKKVQSTLKRGSSSKNLTLKRATSFQRKQSLPTLAATAEELDYLRTCLDCVPAGLTTASQIFVEAYTRERDRLIADVEPKLRTMDLNHTAHATFVPLSRAGVPNLRYVIVKPASFHGDKGPYHFLAPRHELLCERIPAHGPPLSSVWEGELLRGRDRVRRVGVALESLHGALVGPPEIHTLHPATLRGTLPLGLGTAVPPTGVITLVAVLFGAEEMRALWLHDGGNGPLKAAIELYSQEIRSFSAKHNGFYVSARTDGGLTVGFNDLTDAMSFAVGIHEYLMGLPISDGARALCAKVRRAHIEAILEKSQEKSQTHAQAPLWSGIPVGVVAHTFCPTAVFRESIDQRIIFSGPDPHTLDLICSVARVGETLITGMTQSYAKHRLEKIGAPITFRVGAVQLTASLTDARVELYRLLPRNLHRRVFPPLVFPHGLVTGSDISPPDKSRRKSVAPPVFDRQSASFQDVRMAFKGAATAVLATASMKFGSKDPAENPKRESFLSPYLPPASSISSATNGGVLKETVVVPQLERNDSAALPLSRDSRIGQFLSQFAAAPVSCAVKSRRTRSADAASIPLARLSVKKRFQTDDPLGKGLSLVSTKENIQCPPDQEIVDMEYSSEVPFLNNMLPLTSLLTRLVTILSPLYHQATATLTRFDVEQRSGVIDSTAADDVADHVASKIQHRELQHARTHALVLKEAMVSLKTFGAVFGYIMLTSNERNGSVKKKEKSVCREPSKLAENPHYIDVLGVAVPQADKYSDAKETASANAQIRARMHIASQVSALVEQQLKDSDPNDGTQALIDTDDQSAVIESLKQELSAAGAANRRLHLAVRSFSKWFFGFIDWSILGDHKRGISSENLVERWLSLLKVKNLTDRVAPSSHDSYVTPTQHLQQLMVDQYRDREDNVSLDDPVNVGDEWRELHRSIIAHLSRIFWHVRQSLGHLRSGAGSNLGASSRSRMHPLNSPSSQVMKQQHSESPIDVSQAVDTELSPGYLGARSRTSYGRGGGTAASSATPTGNSHGSTVGGSLLASHNTFNYSSIVPFENPESAIVTSQQGQSRRSQTSSPAQRVPIHSVALSQVRDTSPYKSPRVADGPSLPTNSAALPAIDNSVPQQRTATTPPLVPVDTSKAKAFMGIDSNISPRISPSTSLNASRTRVVGSTLGAHTASSASHVNEVSPHARRSSLADRTAVLHTSTLGLAINDTPSLPSPAYTLRSGGGGSGPQSTVVKASSQYRDAQGMDAVIQPKATLQGSSESGPVPHSPRLNPRGSTRHGASVLAASDKNGQAEENRLSPAQLGLASSPKSSAAHFTTLLRDVSVETGKKSALSVRRTNLDDAFPAQQVSSVPLAELELLSASQPARTRHIRGIHGSEAIKGGSVESAARRKVNEQVGELDQSLVESTGTDRGMFGVAGFHSVLAGSSLRKTTPSPHRTASPRNGSRGTVLPDADAASDGTVLRLGGTSLALGAHQTVERSPLSRSPRIVSSSTPAKSSGEQNPLGQEDNVKGITFQLADPDLPPSESAEVRASKIASILGASQKVQPEDPSTMVIKGLARNTSFHPEEAPTTLADLRRRQSVVLRKKGSTEALLSRDSAGAASFFPRRAVTNEDESDAQLLRVQSRAVLKQASAPGDVSLIRLQSKAILKKKRSDALSDDALSKTNPKSSTAFQFADIPWAEDVSQNTSGDVPSSPLCASDVPKSVANAPVVINSVIKQPLSSSPDETRDVVDAAFLSLAKSTRTHILHSSEDSLEPTAAAPVPDSSIHYSRPGSSVTGARPSTKSKLMNSLAATIFTDGTDVHHSETVKRTNLGMTGTSEESMPKTAEIRNPQRVNAGKSLHSIKINSTVVAAVASATKVNFWDSAKEKNAAQSKLLSLNIKGNAPAAVQNSTLGVKSKASATVNRGLRSPAGPKMISIAGLDVSVLGR